MSSFQKLKNEYNKSIGLRNTWTKKLKQYLSLPTTPLYLESSKSAHQIRSVTSIVKNTVVKISIPLNRPPILASNPSNVERNTSIVLIMINPMIVQSATFCHIWVCRLSSKTRFNFCLKDNLWLSSNCLFLSILFGNLQIFFPIICQSKYLQYCVPHIWLQYRYSSNSYRITILGLVWCRKYCILTPKSNLLSSIINPYCLSSI